MKFAHSLKFNAVPEWQDNYVSYPTLKKVIYKLQQQQLEAQPNDGSYIVEPLNPTTVTELVSRARINQEGSVSTSQNDSDILQGSSGPSKFAAARLISRFKKQKHGDSEAALEKGYAGSSSAHYQEDQNSKEKSNSAVSFTYDLGNSSMITFSGNSSGDYSDPKSGQFDPLKVFTKHLLEEITKINDFYLQNQNELFLQYDNLIKDLESNKINIDDIYNVLQNHHGEDNNIHHLDSHPEMIHDLERQPTLAVEKFDEDDEDEDEDDEDDDDEETHSQNSALLHHSVFEVKQQTNITLRKKSIALFISLSELKSFIELNKIGFTKITKKFDKTCNYSIKADFIENFLPSNTVVFQKQTINEVDYRINQIVKIYAFLSSRLTNKTTPQDLESVKLDLKSHLRDHIVWERNTVWKDLLSLEKKSYNLQLGNTGSSTNKMGDEGLDHDSIMYLNLKTYKLPGNMNVFGLDHITVPSFLITWQVLKLVVIIITFVILLTVKTFNDLEQHRCLAVLVASAMLWASEALPLYVTSMLVPLLVVTCKVLKDDDGNAMDGESASKYILSTMWSSVIMLLMGGFTLAAALSKYNIAKVISSYILALAGTKPRNVLLAIMSVSLFLAMWISNVAAPVLCFSLIQPVLRTLPTESPLARALVLGIALASNMAGMASPIASPQNMIAIESMNPSPGWGKWFAVALPVSIIGMLGIWVLLILTFDISKVKVQAFKPIKEKFTIKQWYISVVTIVTIILWCVLSKITSTFGESGIISCIPIVLFFGTGLLKVEDLNMFPWNIVILAMGGIALGKGVSSSGLLSTIATALQHKIMHFNVFVILIIFGILILVVATFVSHTVAALIIIPLVKEVGDSLPHPHPLLLVMGTALLASAAMGLPTSGFPNVTAISMTDEVGKPYLTVNMFISRGVPASIIGYICVITLGYGIMNATHF